MMNLYVMETEVMEMAHEAKKEEAVNANSKHYGDPSGGCMSDEMAIRITGVTGGVCSPACGSDLSCPSDVPDGVTAMPQCALQSPTGDSYCALICTPASWYMTDAEKAVHDGDACGAGASCKSISGVGICTYDDSELYAAPEYSVKTRDFGRMFGMKRSLRGSRK